MRILVAPDKFKGSLDASGVAENIAIGLREVLPKAQIDTLPMADGGEGTASVIANALGGSWVQCQAHDPLGRTIECRYAIVRGTLAVMEMSEAAGLWRLKENERDPLRATTFGVGEMILDATRRGATEIIIGLGGSATNDGGFGLARAIGFRFFDDAGDQLRSALAKLCQLKRIDAPANLALPSITAAVDVQNKLLGKNGATKVFGPQKGATAQQLDVLERALTRLADVSAKQLRVDYRAVPGAGAAGGLGFGLKTFAGATIQSGFDVVSKVTGLEAKVEKANLVITGEGSLDAQTLDGKTAAGISRIARKFDKRVFAIVGQTSSDPRVEELFDKIFQLERPGISRAESMRKVTELLQARSRELGKIL